MDRVAAPLPTLAPVLGLALSLALSLALGLASLGIPRPAAAEVGRAGEVRAEALPGSALRAEGVCAGEVCVGDELEEVLLDLRMGRLTRRLVPALSRGDEVFLPVVEFLELAEVRFTNGDAQVRAVRQPGNLALAWHAEADTREVALHGGRVYATLARLERDFDVRFSVDWSELLVTVFDPGHLPVGLRAAREARWAAFRPGAGPGIPGVRAPAERTLGASPYRAGGFVADWTLVANAGQPGETASGGVALGGQLLGGSIQLSARSEGPLAGGRGHLAASYHLARPRGSALRQLRLGDGFLTGPRPRAVAGIQLTNAPFVRDLFFGFDSFEGRFGPGWDVELRQFGQTVDLRRADEEGAFALDIPLQYGDNALEVVGYGPHGEVVTMDRLLLLRADRLPAGHLEWSLAAGACRMGTRCAAAGNMDLRYGITRRWTARGGVEVVERMAGDSLPGGVLPYLELSGTPLRPLHLSVEWLAGSLTRGSLFLTPTPDFRLRVAATVFEADSTRALFHDPGRRGTWEADVQLRPFAGARSVGFSGALVREERIESETTRARALATVQRPRLRIEGGVETTDIRWAGNAFPADRNLRPVGSLSSWIPWLGNGIHAPWVRVEAEFTQAFEPDRLRAQLGRAIGERGRLEVGTRWSRRFGTEFTASLTAELSALRSVSQWFAPEGERGNMIQYLQGSVLWDEAEGRIRTAALPNLERAGVSGVVFLDENGNGVRDPGEPGVPGVRVVVEGRSVLTDAEGRYTADHLLPFESTRLSIHGPSIPNPTWMPAFGSLDVPLAPSSYRRVDLPLVRTAEVMGRVVRVDPAAPGGEVGVSGAEILLIGLGPGARTFEATTFRDGRFYFMGIPPGGYELRLTPGILRGLGLSPDTPRRGVVVDADGRLSTSPPVIRLQPDAGP